MANLALRLCSASLLCISLLAQGQGWASEELTAPSAAASSTPSNSAPDQDAFNAGRMQGKLESALAFNPQLEGFSIAVAIDARTAVLTGAVATQTQKDLAGEIARKMEGIESVENRLTIAPELAHTLPEPAAAAIPNKRDFSQFAKDLSTTAAIKARLVAHEHVNGMSIKVETYQGRVTLSGEAESQVQKDLAEFVAKKHTDTAHLENRIVIIGP